MKIYIFSLIMAHNELALPTLSVAEPSGVSVGAFSC